MFVWIMCIVYLTHITVLSSWGSFWSTLLYFEAVLKNDVQHGDSLVSCLSDGDLKTDGFSIESCRSMVAVMDVSFLSLVDFFV